MTLCLKLDDLMDQGILLENMEDGKPLSSIRDRVQSANVYFGAAPIAEALERGAQIIITAAAPIRADTGADDP